jgi:hypothetical protein
MIPAALAWHGNLIPRAETTVRVDSDASLLSDNTTWSKGVFGRGKWLFRMINTPPVPALPEPPKGTPRVDFFRGGYPKGAIDRAKARCPVVAGDGFFLIRAEKFESISGDVGGQALRANRLSLTAPKGQTYSVTATPLDGKSVGESGRLLITLGPVSLAEGTVLEVKKDFTGRVTGLWERTRIERNPRIKPSAGRVSIRREGPMKGFILDISGRRSRELDVKYANGALEFAIQPADRALWYLLEDK